MSKSPKKKITKQTGSISYSNLQQIVDTAKSVIKSCGDTPGGPQKLSDFCIQYETGYYDDCWAVLEYEVLETDDQYEARLRRERLDKENRERRDREQYEMLKKRYGNA